MTSLNDEQLLQYSERSNGKVVLVTGAYQNAVVLGSLLMKDLRVIHQVRHLELEKRPRWCSPISSELSKRSSNVHRGHRETSRAKLVLGDLNAAGIDEVITQIKESGGCVIVICPKIVRRIRVPDMNV